MVDCFNTEELLVSFSLIDFSVFVLIKDLFNSIPTSFKTLLPCSVLICLLIFFSTSSKVSCKVVTKVLSLGNIKNPCVGCSISTNQSFDFALKSVDLSLLFPVAKSFVIYNFKLGNKGTFIIYPFFNILLPSLVLLI